MVGGHLKVRGISMRFDNVIANEDVDLEVQPGKIVGMIGPNGAGKTTFFDCVTGFLTPTEGTVEFDGRDITHMSPPDRVELGMSRTFQMTQLFAHLTVRENLLLGRQLHTQQSAWKYALRLPSARRAERDAAEYVEVLAEEFGLSDVLSRRSGDLPYGTAKLVSFARALATEPKLLLLDEPSAGMDSAESAGFSQMLKEAARRRGISVLVIEHDMGLVLGICDLVAVLDAGRVVAEGTPVEIRSDDRVRSAYLGAEPTPAYEGTTNG